LANRTRLTNDVASHISKAREAALLAVEVYNKPSVKFKSGGYIVMMCIAWTALFHAISFKSGTKPFYRNKRLPRRYEKVDGDYKAWELGECVARYFADKHPPARTNLEFFVGLRNKIEHRSMPEIDHTVFGECQALLFNFEDLLVEEFGSRYAVNESLTMALQFSTMRHEAQERAIKKQRSPFAKNVRQYIETFRSSLSSDVRNDMSYSFKVFLLPKIANHQGSADLAVEWLAYDASNPEQMAQYDKVVSLLKPSVIQVANPGRLRPKDVCDAVEPVLVEAFGKGTKFGASHHHVKACRYYRVRPKKGQDKRKTNPTYCQYDEAHDDYVYTDAWKDFLLSELVKPGQLQKVLKSS
jgi:hypothetical protein